MQVLQVHFDPHGSPALLAQRLQEAVQAGARSLLVLAGDGVTWPAAEVDPLLQGMPVPVFGGVFPQVLYGTTHTETGLLVMALRNEAVVTTVEGLDTPGTDFQAALAAAAARPSRMQLVLVDGLAPFIADFIEAVFEQIGGGASFLGGGAGSLSFEVRPCLFTPGGLRSGVGLVVGLDSPLGIGVHHGWQSISGPFVVTGSEGNTITSLDYRPAAEVYRACVEPIVGETLTPENFFQHAKAHPFGIERVDGSLLVRDPIVMRGDHLVCVGAVPVQRMVYILRGQPDELISAAQQGTVQAVQALQATGRPAAGGLLVDCISRVLFLGPRFGDELQAASQHLQQAAGPEAPLFGVLSLGEIANNGTHVLDFYNKTFVLGAYAHA
jgi:hypothetical protein